MARHTEYILIILCACVSVIQMQEFGCPSKCVCFRTTVRCMFLQLDKIPTGIPPDTTVLDMRFNRIIDIPRGSFIGLSNLNTLLLNNNKITRLVDHVFDGLPELRYLYLYKNEISAIQSQAFKNLGKLEQLFLHNNNIETIPEGSFLYNSNLQRLRLDSNPLRCDCDMLWLAEKLRQSSSRIQAAAICQQPQQHQGRALSSISASNLECGIPRFSLEPSDVDISLGNTVFFPCRAIGTPTPNIVWLHNEVEVDLRDERKSVSDDGTLMIHNTQNSDAGYYECVARNNAGEIKTRRAQLQFQNNPVRPQFTVRPSDTTVVVGESARLSCGASGQPEPTITWTRNGNAIPSSFQFTHDPAGDLIINNIQPEHHGLYRCSASNNVQTITAEARVHVHVRPTFIRTPNDEQVVEGATTMFRCEATGMPEPRVTWLKDVDSPLPNNNRIQLLDGGAMLRILAVDRTDQGVYVCRATNDAGTRETTAELVVTPQTPAATLNTKSEVNTVEGGDIILQCDAEADPTPQYRWIKDGVSLRTGPKYTLQGNRMIIRNVVHGDEGSYECFPENTVGFARNVITLHVLRRGVGRPIREGDRFVEEAIRQATNQVNAAVNQTLTGLFDRSREHTVQDLISIFRYPSADTLELARAEEIFEQTLELIHRHVREGHQYNVTGHGNSYKEIVSPGHLELIANMSGCFANIRITRCSNMCYHKRYRSMDGACNNLERQETQTWGASVIAFDRLLPAIYENGFNAPVGWDRGKLYNNFHLPSPRLVSSYLMSTDHVTEDERSTHMLMQWGQFVDHDITLTPQSISYARFSDGRRCNETCDKEYPCYPIPVPHRDVRIQAHTCLGFTRSSAMCNSGSTSVFYKTFAPRQQINAVTAFIDASNVYGSSDFEAQRLREQTNGRGQLNVGVLSTDGKRLLPFDNAGFLEHADCQIEPSKRHVPCFRAGDPRANEHLALTAMHTLWMREHNRLARELLDLNPHWDGNMLYHETRKIIGAQMQHITYSHWLPHIIGQEGMERLGNYKGYDPTANPSISNEFATAAMRFGHSLVQPIIFRLNSSFYPTPEGNLPLHKAFFSPYRLLEEGGIDPLVRGMFATSAKKRMPSEMMNSELTEKLFALANVVGQDLAALNIQRGRDHALPFYNEYRRYCNLSVATSFEDFRNEIQDRRIREKLQALYRHPDNVDLFVGGMGETPLEGAKVGPTFMCILVDQFRKLRDGDRFWYENPGVFSPEQVTAIKQVTLSAVICESSDSINQVQKNVFLRVNDNDEYLSCSKIPKFNLKMWSDCCSDCGKSGDFQSLTSHFHSRRTSSSSSSSDRRFSFREDREHNNRFRDNTAPNSRNPDFTSTNSIYNIQFQDQMKEVDTKMKTFDSRIEGMETMVSSLNDVVKHLKRKMKRMKRHMKKQGLNCIDDKGNVWSHKDRWDVNDCKTCACTRGKIECDVVQCPPLPQCTNPRKVDKQCCPVC